MQKNQRYNENNNEKKQSKLYLKLAKPLIFPLFSGALPFFLIFQKIIVIYFLTKQYLHSIKIKNLSSIHANIMYTSMLTAHTLHLKKLAYKNYFNLMLTYLLKLFIIANLISYILFIS